MHEKLLRKKLFIDDTWCDAASGEEFVTVNPATEEPICSVPRGRKEDVERACAAARVALDGPWSQLTPFERGRLLFRLADAIEANLPALARLESMDVGKPTGEAEGDIRGVANCFRYNAGAADKLEGATIPLGRDTVDFTSLEPIGVTGHIVPWNYPLGMVARSLAPALAAGCTAVVKPAEQSPLTALALGQLCMDVGIPKGVVNVVTGYGHEAGEALVRDPRVRCITFTGSVETGKKVYKAAAEDIKAVVLELGGKNPMIVFPDADIDRATTDALDASFGNSGQVCSSASRYILHRDIRDAFLARLEEKVATLTVGMPEDNPTLGPVVSSEQYDKVMSYVEQARDAGTPVRFGGGRAPGFNKGFFIEPTLFTDVDPASPIAREEVFGPVVVEHRFNTEDEAIALANGLETGLVAGIYTRDISRAHALSRKLDFGSIWINGWFIGGLQAPTGGNKQSGLGRERGLPGIHNYLSIKNIGIRL